MISSIEDAVDRIILELETLRNTAQFQAILPVEVEIKLDDPGFVAIYDYPYIFVQPVLDEEATETMGLPGYDVRMFNINVGIAIDQSSYFDASVNELPGTRELMQAMRLIGKLFRRLSKSQLDGQVRKLRVPSIAYMPDVRGEGILIRLAVANLVVEVQDQHEA